jgi:hypothetical protein
MVPSTHPELRKWREAGSKPYKGIIIKIPAQLQASTAIPNISKFHSIYKQRRVKQIKARKLQL